MTDLPVCPTCSNPIPLDAPGGLCPVCLLARAQQQETDPLPPPSQNPYSSPTPQELAADFPQLEVLEAIGRGGMGTVYRARQRHLDRLVALKIMRPDLSAQPAFTERFAREARALARLSHPHLVTVHDFGQSPRWCWIIMEYVDGANLRQVLRGGHFTQRQALEIVPQLCSALQYAHDRGVVHRDIKPENILLDQDGLVKIADFGLAKLMAADPSQQVLTATHDVVGTAHYMAPEQIEHSREVDHRADIYSMGVVFYEMLTGGLPLGRFEPPSKSTASSPHLDPVVMRTLAKDPGQRYQQASEVTSAIRQVESQGLATARPIPATASSAVDELDASILVVTGGLLALMALLDLPHSFNSDLKTPQVLVLVIGGLVLWGGIQRLRPQAQRSWTIPAKFLCAVAIPFSVVVQPMLTVVLIVLTFVWFLRYRRGQPVPGPGQLPGSPPAGATAAAAAPPAPHPDRLLWRWLWWTAALMVDIYALLKLLEVEGRHTSHTVGHWILWATVPATLMLFLIYLPRSRDARAAAGPASPSARSGGRILALATLAICVSAIVVGINHIRLLHQYAPGYHFDMSIDTEP